MDDDIHIKVKDHVKVEVMDPFYNLTRVHVHRENGDHSYAWNSPYLATNDDKNINCQYDFEDPNNSFILKYDGKRYPTSLGEGYEGYGKITCRHLAIDSAISRYSATHNSRLKGDWLKGIWKDHRRIFLESQKQANHVFYDAGTHESLISQTRFCERFIMKSHQFPDVLASLFHNKILQSELKEGEFKENVLYLSMRNEDHTMGHAMCLVMKVKHQGGKNIFKLKLYDPNRSFNHISFTTDDLEMIQKFDMDKIMSGKYKGLVNYNLALLSDKYLENHGNFLSSAPSGSHRLTWKAKTPQEDGSERDTQGFLKFDVESNSFTQLVDMIQKCP